MKSPSRRYTTTVTMGRPGRVMVPVPFDPDEAWGAKREHHVAGSVNGMGVRAVIEPLDVAVALGADPDAGAFFDSIAQFYRNAYLRWIDGTKRRPDLRAARIAEVVDLLRAGVKQRPGT